MITVNSLSGGKTSSYIAAHYPADIDVFALVCIDDHNANAVAVDMGRWIGTEAMRYFNYPPQQ